jgi:hypothetical protein
METAWGPLPEIWDLMAEKYALEYVYISEECGCSVYVNTDSAGRFFATRYLLDYFDVDDLELDSAVLQEYGERLREFGAETRHYDSFDEVLHDFAAFGFAADDVDELNQHLEKFNIMVHEYSAGEG